MQGNLEIEVTVDTVPPTTPTGLTASIISYDRISLRWDVSTDTGGSGLKGYRIYRDGKLIADVLTNNFEDSGLDPLTTYTYMVEAYDNAGNESKPSTPASATTPPEDVPPSIPTGLVGSPVSSTQISLNWNPSSDVGGSGLAGYRIYRGGEPIPIATVRSESYQDDGLSPLTTYTYTVAAFDSAGNVSQQSVPISVTTLPDTEAPSTPTGLIATAVSAGRIDLSWNPSTDTGGAGLAGYKIFRDNVLIDTSEETSYQDMNLSQSTTYSYAVASFDSADNTSRPSDTVSATTLEVDTKISLGPSEGVEIGTSSVSFSFEGVNIEDLVEFSYRLNVGETVGVWSDWSGETEVVLKCLEESSLVGEYTFEVKSRSSAGDVDKTPARRSFTVNAIQGPALRFRPGCPLEVSLDSEFTLEIIAEEVTDLMLAHLIIDFDASKLELIEVKEGKGFFEKNGGTLVWPTPRVGDGSVDISAGVGLGDPPGVDGTGALGTLRFRAKGTGTTEVEFDPRSELRDHLNDPIAPLSKVGVEIVVR